MNLKKIRQERSREPLKKTFRGAARKRRSRSLEDIAYLSRRGIIAEAAANAIKRQLKNGVSAVWMENGNIYRVYPNGNREIIAGHTGSFHKMTKGNHIIQIK